MDKKLTGQDQKTENWVSEYLAASVVSCRKWVILCHTDAQLSSVLVCVTKGDTWKVFKKI